MNCKEKCSECRPHENISNFQVDKHYNFMNARIFYIALRSSFSELWLLNAKEWRDDEEIFLLPSRK